MQKLMKEAEVAEVLGISTRTIQAWRWKGDGPEYVKVGGSVRYKETDVEAFLRPCTSTSQEQMSS